MRNGIDFSGGTYIIGVTQVIKYSTGLGPHWYSIKFTLTEKPRVSRIKRNLIKLSKWGLQCGLTLKLFLFRKQNTTLAIKQITWLKNALAELYLLFCF